MQQTTHPIRTLKNLLYLCGTNLQFHFNMACSTEFIEFVCSQLNPIGTLRSRKMFGDWMIYINEKPIVLCCDNIAYVKKHPAISSLTQDAECGYPYQGAKEHYILDIEHIEIAQQIVSTLEKVSAPPKPRRKK